MSCSPIRTFTLLLLFIALITTLYEVSKKFPVGSNQKNVTLKSSVVRYTPDDELLGSRRCSLSKHVASMLLDSIILNGSCIAAQPQQAMAKAGEQAWGDGKKGDRLNSSSDAKAQCCRCSLRGGATTQEMLIPIHQHSCTTSVAGMACCPATDRESASRRWQAMAREPKEKGDTLAS